MDDSEKKYQAQAPPGLDLELTDPARMGEVLWEHEPSGIFTMDASGKVTRASPWMLKLLGSPDERTTCLFNVFALPTVPEPVRAWFKAALPTGEGGEIDCDYTSMHGKTSRLRFRTVCIVKEGRVVGAIVRAWDIAFLKGLEEQIRRASKVDSLVVLASSLAHDLNNLFTTMLGYSSLLQQDAFLPPDKRERALQAIQGAARSGARIVEQVLGFTSERDAHAPACDFGKAFQQAVDLFSFGVGKGIRLEVRNAAAGVRVRGSATKVEQVLVNIALNARDAIGTAEGTVAVTASRVRTVPEQMHLKPAVAAAEYVRVSLRDTGCGIPEENMARLFHPYFTTKPAGRGTGLGLSSVWGIMREVDGGIRVESTVGKGTRFDVYFPVTTEAEVSVAEKVPVISQLAGAGERVVVAVPEGELRELLSWILLKNGYKAVAAGTGREGLAALDSIGASVDAVVVDMQLSPEEAAGLEARCRALGKPLLSLCSTPRDCHLIAGPRLCKPFAPEQFLAALAGLFASRQS
jgi:signal transduction histidine kinase/CheY-like chemotaxis protein